MTPPPDRLAKLRAQSVLTGLDFVYVDPSQVDLDVYFLHPPSGLSPTLTTAGRIAPGQIRIYADGAPDVPVEAVPTWTVVDGRDVLQIKTLEPGGFARYRLAITDPQIDPYFAEVDLNFKANCPSDLDCKPAAHDCPPPDGVDFPVDYQARDFWSFRRALLELATARYPEWQDRLEADVGVMLAELMSALGDELAYYQDRGAREAHLETATQRRSVRRLARLVDYWMHDGLGATGVADVHATADGVVQAGIQVVARSRVGQDRDVVFEIGHGLAESIAKQPYAVKTTLNSINPHLWDELERATCLPIGSTSLWLDGHVKADLETTISEPGKRRRVLLRTDPTLAGKPARRVIVDVLDIVESTDPLLAVPITKITWDPAQATRWELDLEVLTVHANLLPITAGRTAPAQLFSIRAITPPPASDPIDTTVERTGPRDTVAHLFPLTGSDVEPLVWLGGSPRTARPELRLTQVTWGGATWIDGAAWDWEPSLLRTVDGASAEPEDTAFTLDDGQWRAVATYYNNGGAQFGAAYAAPVVHRDYATGAGFSLRFGDGEFGRIPPVGTVFRLRYRLGNGTIANVAPDMLTELVVPTGFAVPPIDATTNPLAITDGVDAESIADVRALAPQAFHFDWLRAVRPEDYAAFAEKLDWVQRAGAKLRWTGSWLACSVTADPRHASTLAEDHRFALELALDRVRQAGREVVVHGPRYADIDLTITLCVEPHAYRGQVKAAVRAALVGKRPPWHPPGFFDPDNFTFGTPLRRSALEAAIHRVPGVRAVESIRIRRRGRYDWRELTALELEVGPDEVIRLDDDPEHPERGALVLRAEGGA